MALSLKDLMNAAQVLNPKANYGEKTPASVFSTSTPTLGYNPQTNIGASTTNMSDTTRQIGSLNSNEPGYYGTGYSQISQGGTPPVSSGEISQEEMMKIFMNGTTANQPTKTTGGQTLYNSGSNIKESTPADVGINPGLITETPAERAAREASEANMALYKKEATPETDEERRQRITQDFQSQIDALNAVYAQQKAEAVKAGLGRLGTDTAIQARRGLIGSSFGEQQTEGVNQENLAEMNKVDVAHNAARAAIEANLRAEISQDRKDKKAAQRASADAHVAYLATVPEKKQKMATNQIKAIIANKYKPTDQELKDWAVQIGIDPIQFIQEYKDSQLKSDQEKQKVAQDLAKAKAEVESKVLDAIKTGADINKVYEAGGYLWQYDPKTGGVTNIGPSRSVAGDNNNFGEISDADKAKGLNWLMSQPDVTQEDIDAFKTDRQAQATILNAMNG